MLHTSARAEIRDELGPELGDAEASERNLPLFPTQRHLRALFALAAEPVQQRLRRTLLFTGIRLPEALALKRGDVDFEKRSIRLSGGRTAFLDAQTAQLLSASDEPGSSPLFPIQAEVFEAQLAIDAETVGITAFYAGANRRFSWRALRHAFGRAAADSGMGILTLHALLGHQFVQTTKMYQRASMAWLRPCYDEASPLPLRSSGMRQPFAVPTRADLATLLDAAKGDQDATLMLWVLYSTGIRIAELAAMAGCDIEGANGEIFIRSGKDDWDRCVLTDSETLQALRAKVGGRPGSIFGMTPNQIHRRLLRYFQSSGLYAQYAAQGKKFTAHALRHAFATHIYENGLDLGMVNRLLGHSTWENTLVYMRTAIRDWRAAFDDHHPWGRRANLQPRRHPLLDELASEFDGELGEGAVTLDKLPLIPTLGDVEALLHSAREKPRHVLVLRLLYAAGMRPRELAALRVQDVCWELGAVTIGEREVYLDDLTRDLLRAQVANEAGSSSLMGMFVEDVLAILGEHAKVTGLWERYKACGRKFSVNALRHAFASQCLDRGMDLFVLRRLLGHRYVGSTAQYLGTMTGSWRAEYRQFHPFEQAGER